MNKLFTILAMAVVAGVALWCGDAWATTTSGQTAWAIATNKTVESFQWARRMIFIIGGFGLIALAFGAIFGKVNWKWFAALCVGLGIVAIAGKVIEYVTVDKTAQSKVIEGKAAPGDVDATMTGLTFTTTSSSGGKK